MSTDFSQAFQWPPQLPEIRQALERAFDSGQWGKYDGDNCQKLTNDLSKLFGLEYVRLCSSGTVATDIALRALGIKEGDHVVLAGYDFPGNFRSIEYVGATPVLADVSPRSWSIDLDSVRQAVTNRTKAIIVSYLHGGLADIKNIVEFARAKEIFVVEDICQCPGAKLEDQTFLGTLGDVCVMSFGGSKLLSAGRGGAMGTHNPTVNQRSTIYCDRGNDAFPLSELQASVLIPQLKLLEGNAGKRAESFRWLAARLENETSIATVEGATSDFFKVPFQLRSVENKQAIIDKLRSKGILIDHGFRGFAGRSSKRCLSPVDLPHSRDAAESTLVLHHPCLLSDQFQQIVEEIVRVVCEFDA